MCILQQRLRSTPEAAPFVGNLPDRVWSTHLHRADDVEGASDAHSVESCLKTINAFHTSFVFFANAGLYTLIAFCCLAVIKAQHKYKTNKIQLYIMGVGST